jgi:Ca2+-transporting ATPase
MKPGNQQEANAWHLLGIKEVLERLAVNPDQGLTDAQAVQRREKDRPGELNEAKAVSATRQWLIILRRELTAPVVLIVIFAVAALLLLTELKSVIAIAAIVSLNVFFLVVQIYRTEQAVATLVERIKWKQTPSPTVRVRRNRQLRILRVCELVPGDIVFLESGDHVPADARLLESRNLRIQEAALTGEAYPVDKTSLTLERQDTCLGERFNMVYMGTTVTSGRGTAVVVEAGRCTELGQIGESNPGCQNH